jgi:amino acid permease
MAGIDTAPEVTAPQRLTLMTMTAMVAGSMVGAGVFSLPRRFAQETGVLGSLIAWVIDGTGMLMLAFVFQMLAFTPRSARCARSSSARPGWRTAGSPPATPTICCSTT